jgi:hypothetical protein
VGWRRNSTSRHEGRRPADGTRTGTDSPLFGAEPLVRGHLSNES